MEQQLISDYIKLFDKIFSKIKKEINEEKVAVLVSGGIDSSIIAFFAKKYFLQCYLYSLGTENNVDFHFVDILKNFLKLPLKKIVIKKNEVIKTKEEVIPILKKNNLPDNITQISLAIAFFLILKNIKQEKINYVFTGQGPDILLAGYHKYKNIPLNKLNQQVKKDLILLDVDKKRDQSVADFFNLKLLNPYLNQEFIDFSLKIPSQLKRKKIGDEIYEKYILRKVGEKIGLPEEIILRHKKALQYSTGVRKILF